MIKMGLSVFGLTALLAACATPAVLRPTAPTTQYICKPYNGVERCYYQIDPAQGNPKASLMVLHPAYTSPARIERLVGVAPEATRRGYRVIYPVGIDGHWNDGRGAGRTKTVEMNTDDVAFLSDVAKTTQIIDKPLYLLGMSNGGMMAMRLVCQSEVRFAGMATVASNLPAGLEANCPQKNPLPVWLWFGSEDRVLPNAGGAIYDNAKAWGVIASKDETIRFWERYNNVFVPPIHEDITTVDDGTRLIRERYKGRAPLVVHTAQGAGHTWPGEPSFFALITMRGKVSYQVDGTTALLDWFDSL